MANCSCCNTYTNWALQESHHKHKRSKGGQDGQSNETILCLNCHTLAHKGEMLLKRGKDDEVVLDFFKSILVNMPNIQVESTARNLLALSHAAARETPATAIRKVVPIEIRVPVELLQRFTSKSNDLHISRNELILWAMNELASGRVILPEK